MTIGGDGDGPGNYAEQLTDSALRYRTQAPIVDALLKEIGMPGAGAVSRSRAGPTSIRQFMLCSKGLHEIGLVLQFFCLFRRRPLTAHPDRREPG